MNKRRPLRKIRKPNISGADFKSEANENSIDSNSPSIRQPLDSKIDSNSPSIRQPLDSKKEHTKNSLDSHCTADSTADKTAIRQPLDSNKTAKVNILELAGKESELVKIIFFSCQNNGSLESENLSTDQLKKTLEVSTKRLGNIVERLTKKAIFVVSFSRRGNGGFRRFKLFSDHYQKMILNHKDSNWTAIRQQKDSHYTAHSTADSTASSHSSSKVLNLKNTTTMENVDNLMLKHNILVPSELNEIGFQESHLNQILKQTTLNEELIQESLNHYALDLRNGSVRAGFGKLNLIIGVLKKSNQYISESYISEEQNMLKELANRAEKLNELKEKQSEIALLKKYKAWKKNLNQDEINKLVPPNNIIEEGGTLQDIQLQSYFETNHNQG